MRSRTLMIGLSISRNYLDNFYLDTDSVTVYVKDDVDDGGKDDRHLIAYAAYVSMQLAE